MVVTIFRGSRSSVTPASISWVATTIWRPFPFERPTSWTTVTSARAAAVWATTVSAQVNSQHFLFNEWDRGYEMSMQMYIKHSPSWWRAIFGSHLTWCCEIKFEFWLFSLSRLLGMISNVRTWNGQHATIVNKITFTIAGCKLQFDVATTNPLSIHFMKRILCVTNILKRGTNGLRSQINDKKIANLYFSLKDIKNNLVDTSYCFKTFLFLFP